LQTVHLLVDRFERDLKDLRSISTSTDDRIVGLSWVFSQFRRRSAIPCKGLEHVAAEGLRKRVRDVNILGKPSS